MTPRQEGYLRHPQNESPALGPRCVTLRSIGPAHAGQDGASAEPSVIAYRQTSASLAHAGTAGRAHVGPPVPHCNQQHEFSRDAHSVRVADQLRRFGCRPADSFAVVPDARASGSGECCRYPLRTAFNREITDIAAPRIYVPWRRSRGRKPGAAGGSEAGWRPMCRQCARGSESPSTTSR